MPRWDSSEIGRLIVPCSVAGILPLCLVFSADLMFGPWSGSMDNLYYLQAIVGPPLIALLLARIVHQPVAAPMVGAAELSA